MMVMILVTGVAMDMMITGNTLLSVREEVKNFQDGALKSTPGIGQQKCTKEQSAIWV